MEKVLTRVPIDEEKKYGLIVSGTEQNKPVAIDEAQQKELLNRYPIQNFSVDELTAGNKFNPYNAMLQMILNQIVESEVSKHGKSNQRKKYFESLVATFEDELAMGSEETNLLERMVSLSRRSPIVFQLMIQNIHSLGDAYGTYEVKVPMTDKKRFRLWLKLIFRDKRREKLVVTNQKDLSAHHQHLLEIMFEKNKVGPFLLDEYHLM